MTKVLAPHSHREQEKRGTSLAMVEPLLFVSCPALGTFPRKSLYFFLSYP